MWLRVAHQIGLTNLSDEEVSRYEAMTGARQSYVQRHSKSIGSVSALHRISAERFRLALILTVLMLSIYFGFILLVAFNKPLLSILLTPGLSLGILLGALVIVAVWVLSFIYVQWANEHYDKVISEVIRNMS